jgi:hypothetical protein
MNRPGHRTLDNRTPAERGEKLRNKAKSRPDPPVFLAWGLLLAAMVGGALPVRAAGCVATVPAVAVTLTAAEPAIDNSLSQPELQALAGRDYHEGRTLGLYTADIAARTRTAMSDEGTAALRCVRVTAVTVELTLAPRRIYVVRERRPGTCGYAAVLGHERKHQAVDDGIVAEYRPRLGAAIHAAISRLLPDAPVPTDGVAAIEARIDRAVDAALKAGFDAMMAERDRRQQAVDSPGEYRRVGAACGDPGAQGSRGSERLGLDRGGIELAEAAAVERHRLDERISRAPRGEAELLGGAGGDAGPQHDRTAFRADIEADVDERPFGSGDLGHPAREDIADRDRFRPDGGDRHVAPDGARGAGRRGRRARSSRSADHARRGSWRSPRRPRNAR